MGHATCSVEGCGRTGRIVRGMCSLHYQRHQSGKPLDDPLVLRGAPVVERFLSMVRKTSTCWEWRGYTQPKGYGIFSPEKASRVLSHRWAYMYWVGPIGEGLQIDHLCRNKSCVNPDHLEAVTATENIRRAAPYWKWVNPDHCPAGHPYTPQNSYYPARGSRMCRTCRRSNDERRRSSRRNEQGVQT